MNPQVDHYLRETPRWRAELEQLRAILLDSALVDLGFDAQVNNALTVFTDYSVQTGQSNYFGQSIQAGVKIGF